MGGNLVLDHPPPAMSTLLVAFLGTIDPHVLRRELGLGGGLSTSGAAYIGFIAQQSLHDARMGGDVRSR